MTKYLDTISGDLFTDDELTEMYHDYCDFGGVLGYESWASQFMEVIS